MLNSKAAPYMKIKVHSLYFIIAFLANASHLYAQDTNLCVAEFEFVLDSNSNIPNKYQFFDLSLGDPDYWLWDFGDGDTSTEQNPQHNFKQEGQYNVCLTIARSNIINCVDTICYLIRMPDYFSFGGFAFAEEQPINNPASTGDTGVAFLYKIYGDKQLMPLDTNIFIDYGYYHFSNKLPGEYLIKVMLSPKSRNYKKYLTTYYPDRYYWKQSQTVLISDSNAYNMHINLAAVCGTEPGPGSISGKVIQEQYPPYEKPYPAYVTEIILASAEGELLDFLFCDHNGEFIFRNLALGNYKLFADHTGKYSLPLEVSLTETSPYIDTLVIRISDHSLTGVVEPKNDELIRSWNIYPNPVSANAQIEISLLKKSIIRVNIMNLVGQTVLHEEMMLPAGTSKVHLNTDGIPPGLYHLQLITTSGESISRKLIKY